MQISKDKPRKISPYWINKENFNQYLKIKNKELKEKDKISKSVANRFRIAHNLFSFIFIGGFASSLFGPLLIMLLFNLDSDIGGKIFISWFGIILLLVALFFFHQAYMGFKHKLTSTINLNKFKINKNEFGYIFVAIDEIKARLLGIAMVILGIFFIAIDLLIYIAFY